MFTAQMTEVLPVYVARVLFRAQPGPVQGEQFRSSCHLRDQESNARANLFVAKATTSLPGFSASQLKIANDRNGLACSHSQTNKTKKAKSPPKNFRQFVHCPK